LDYTKLTNALSSNERAVEYLENHNHLISNRIFLNAEAIHIIEKRIQYDKHGNVNRNKNAVNFLRNNRQYIDYKILCGQEHGIEFVEELIKNNELDKINWCNLSQNSSAMHILNDLNNNKMLDWISMVWNKNAITRIENNIDMLDWCWDSISAQPHLIHIIEKKMYKIKWGRLSSNYNAIHILEKNISKIDVYNLCRNTNGFHLLLRIGHEFNNNIQYDQNIVFEYFDYCEKNNIPFNLINMLSEYGYTVKHMEFLQHNNNYEYLSKNPNIFEYDYKRMRETRQALLWYNDIKK